MTTKTRDNRVKVEPLQPASVGTDKTVQMNIDVSKSARDKFHIAARVSGKPLKEWAEDALKEIAEKQLQEKGITIPFDLPPSRQGVCLLPSANRVRD